MQHNPIKLFFVALAAGFLILAGASPEAGAAGQDQTEGAQIARHRCTTCHEADMIGGQRLSRQGWTREVEKMIRWGATVPDSEKEKLIDYLAANFPVRKMSDSGQTASTAERGKAIFEARCTTCHEMDMVEQQRLSRQAWTREVDKMIRWGAKVPEEDKAPLVDYLSASFGLRPLKK